MKKTFKIIGNVLVVIIVVFAALMTVYALAASANSDKIPTIGNKMSLAVQTESMNPTIKQGDIIIGERPKVNELQVGDVITFWTDLNNDGELNELNTHRITGITTSDDGYIYFTTKGDNNTLEDMSEVAHINVVAKWTGVRIPAIGAAISYLQTPNGFLICVVIPLILFFLFELYRFIVMLVKKPQMTDEEREELKKKAVEEYLASTGKKPSDETPPEAPADDVETPVDETPVDDAPDETPVDETPLDDAPDEGSVD